MSSSVSNPSFVFLSESESSIPTMQTFEDASIAAITSGVKPGGVSTITKSDIDRSVVNTSRRKSTVTVLAWSGLVGARSTLRPDECLAGAALRAQHADHRCECDAAGYRGSASARDGLFERERDSLGRFRERQ